MSGISYIGYMNVRHQLPTTGIRQTQAKLNSAPFKQAEIHTNQKFAKTSQHATLVKVDIDQYPCRKVFGYRKPEDYAREKGQQGLENVKAITSKHTQGAWDAAKNAARPGHNVPIEEAKANLRNQVIKWPQWTMTDIPDPVFTVIPSRIEGSMDPGSTDLDIQTTDKPDFDYTPGKAETYMKDKGFIRMWMTKGYIDVEA